MTKDSQEFHDFLRDHVNLNQSRFIRLKSGVRGVTDCLKSNLEEFQTTERQGSYALGTLIKPVDENDEYDADIQVVMTYDPAWDAKTYIASVHAALKENANYADKLSRKTRCITVDYKGEFHLDVVPRFTKIENGKENHYICNRLRNEFEQTDGIGYRDWFNDKNQITDGNLKCVVRLLKFMRDHKNSFTAKSILLTTLAGKAIHDSHENTEAVRTIADTFVTILEHMDEYLQAHPSMPDIANPVLANETFNRHWTEVQYRNFRDKINSYTKIAKEAKDNADKNASIKNWRKLFGDDFGKGSTDDDGNNSQNPNKPNSDNSGNNSGSSSRSTPFIIPASQLRKPYAGERHEVSKITSTPNEVSIAITSDDIEALKQFQPKLNYDQNDHVINGILHIAARYKQDSIFEINDNYTSENTKEVIIDNFDIEIRLSFKRRKLNPWPIVIARGERIQNIMRKHQITDIKDLHFFEAKHPQISCLGIDIYSDPPTDIIRFIKMIVIPFFYRVAYVDRHGLHSAREDLWPEYSHENGIDEYLHDIFNTIP